MPKETVHGPGFKKSLIGELISHPTYGIGLVTSHMIYPYDSAEGVMCGSVYTVIWAGTDRNAKVGRDIIEASSVLDSERY
jgi:hypothetical protein